jgi:hypothetical protein
MSDLIDFVIDRHGGLQRWQQATSVSAGVHVHGGSGASRASRTCWATGGDLPRCLSYTQEMRRTDMTGTCRAQLRYPMHRSRRPGATHFVLVAVTGPPATMGE